MATPALTGNAKYRLCRRAWRYPAGSFTMGALAGEFDTDETPSHAVYLDGYYIDTLEVTNAQFARFTNDSGYQTDAEKAGDSTTWRSFNSADRQRSR